ncbi:MAG TPA: CpsB/CapC family capsule biosynthesis tyrosine phosphatase [Gemmatimonadales bacterium]|nr:CpsB/CapC family capsule biosynthesis tyrosine phosphatase [Gemmatimonadales bacterium]
MIDLHTHLLPAVDDGSRSVAQSVAVLDRYAREGVTAVCLTPHLLASEAAAPPPAHDAAFEALRLAAPAVPALHRGAEVMLDRPLPAAAAERRTVTLAGSHHILVEFPRLVAYQTVANALHHVVQLGLVPLLAHPERYACCSPGAVEAWRRLGALMQVDATTLASGGGRGDRARQLVARGLADILAADNHGDRRGLLVARELLLEHGGEAQADLLLVANPAAILTDGIVEAVPPLELRASIAERLKRIFHREDT